MGSKVITINGRTDLGVAELEHLPGDLLPVLVDVEQLDDVLGDGVRQVVDELGPGRGGEDDGSVRCDYIYDDGSGDGDDGDVIN